MRSQVQQLLATIVSAVIPLAVGIITIPIYIQAIGPVKYGALALTWALLGHAAFLDFGIGRSIAQKLPKLPINSSAVVEYARAALSFAIVVGLASYLLLHALTWAWPNSLLPAALGGIKDKYDSLLRIALLIIPASILMTTIVGILQGQNKILEMAIVNGVGQTLVHIFPLVVALAGFDELVELTVAIVIARYLNVLIAIGLIKPSILGANPKHRKLTSVIRDLFGYGRWAAIIAFLAPLLVLFDRLVVGYFLGAESVAYYSIPVDVISKLLIIPGALATVLFPFLASQSQLQTKEVELRLTLACATAGTFVATSGILFSNFAIAAWMGADFAMRSAWVSEILWIGVWANFIITPIITAYLARMPPRELAILYVFEIVVFVPILFLLVSKIGIIGAATVWALRAVIDGLLILRVNNIRTDSIRFLFLDAIALVGAYATACIFEGVFVRALIFLAILFIFVWRRHAIFADWYRQSLGTGA